MEYCLWHVYFQCIMKHILRNLSQILYHNHLSVRYVDQLSIGEEVLVEENNELIAMKVINISSIIMQGNCYS